MQPPARTRAIGQGQASTRELRTGLHFAAPLAQSWSSHLSASRPSRRDWSQQSFLDGSSLQDYFLPDLQQVTCRLQLPFMMVGVENKSSVIDTTANSDGICCMLPQSPVHHPFEHTKAKYARLPAQRFVFQYGDSKSIQVACL